ncbi:MAG: 2-C-methyl-D-erythritol 4-phosphate cytidylyltransferase [Eubacteriales bacterium]|nr:2-C-methyl-D-erythritol 4-phosphate cytidylyltransferase [Eubacteriales bacterium]
MKDRHTAIVLSAGRGTRMQTEKPKQYLEVKGKPIIVYTLEAFQNCSFIDDIILVCGKEDVEYCRREIAEKYHLDKISKIVPGGKERYHSVFKGLEEIEDTDYVYIHDGARPFVTEEILDRIRRAVEEHHAAIAGMPVKDTIKIADEDGFARYTPKRSEVWQIQTPQAFDFTLIREAYRKLLEDPNAEKLGITDDAMVVETMTEQKVYLVEASYSNIKITTPEDLKWFL